MMSIQSRRELLAAVAPRYWSASKAQKKRILDEFVASTGYHRKYAIHLLRNPPPPRRRQPRHRKPTYSLHVKAALIQLWRIANCICAKRLVPYLPELIAVLERHHELELDDHTKSLLLRLSSATADRLLRTERQHYHRRGLGTTKPGTLLKKSICIRTFADWNEAQPGFVEVDLVAHGGPSARGHYLHSLVLTDIATGWSECVALLNRGQRRVFQALVALRQHLPFPLLGIDSDNGVEFINGHLLRYCQQQHITFTRSREYKKNDQAHVEQKNWCIVRQMVGYDRYVGTTAFRKLAALYRVLRLYVNFCQPVMKLMAKERVGSKVKKRYDTARTPYQRVQESSGIAAESKSHLRQQYLSLNPVTLLRQIESLQDDLWREAMVRFRNDATIPTR